MDFPDFGNPIRRLTTGLVPRGSGFDPEKNLAEFANAVDNEEGGGELKFCIFYFMSCFINAFHVDILRF
jgi:hypothetical protein